jgi:glyoxylase-like metal-dependent hydrolase (beta-lactamase superfamily II)
MKSVDFRLACSQWPHKVALISGMSLCLLFPALVTAQSPPLEPLRLSDKALLIKGPDANVLAVESSEGLILVDGGHASWYDGLRNTLEEYFPGTPIRALINTQWHPEQTGANVPLGTEGVEIIAHENTMLWLSTEVWQRWSDTRHSPMPEAGLPTTTFWDDGAIQIGDQTVHYGFMWNAHTDGDVWVYFEEEDILATGGLVSNGRWPEIDWSTGGYIGGMLDGFVSLLTVPNEDTIIIPADGESMTLSELRAQNQMYLTIFDRLHASVINSSSIEDILAENLTAEYAAEMGDSSRFMTQALQSFQGRYRDPQNFRLLNIP